MTIRATASRLLVAAALGAAMWSTPMIAGSADAAPCPGGQISDPITGLCWSQNSPNNSYGGSGNVSCQPGRLGLCLGALQNMPVPGATLPGANPNGSWP